MRKLIFSSLGAFGLIAAMAAPSMASPVIGAELAARHATGTVLADYYYNHHHYRHRHWDEHSHHWHYSD